MSSPESGEGKKSWRQSDPAAKPAAEPASEGPAGEAAAPAPAKSRRYLGGKTSASIESRAPLWYRLLVPTTALALIVAALVVLALAIQFWYAKPVLIAWAVTDYESKFIPINEFAHKDVETIRSQSAFDTERLVTNNSPQEVSYFEDVGATVGKIDAKTLVVYVSAHGVVEGGEPVLLTAEKGRESRYPVQTLLERIAQSPSRNKLLILDATRIDAEFEMGLLGNDFAELLEARFDKIDKGPGSFWLVASGRRGEKAWASRRIGHSVFGALAAYALRGGVGVDARTASGDGGEDSLIWASEFVDFIRPRVSAWASANRIGSTQNLLVKTHGPDFEVRSVDRSVTSLATMDAPPDAGKGSKKKPTPPAAEAPAEGEGAAKPDKQPPPEIAEGLQKDFESLQKKGASLEKTLASLNKGEEVDPAVLDRGVESLLQDLWEFRDRIEARGEARRRSIADFRPYEWAGFNEKLLLLEKRYLAGEAARVGREILDVVLRDAQTLLRPMDFEEGRFEWSAAFADDQNKDDPLGELKKRLAGFLKDPKDVKVFEEGQPATAERSLAAMLRKEYVENEQWRPPMDAFLLKTALETRETAEATARLPDPRLDRILRRSIEEADDARRSAELALLLGRVDQARSRYGEAGPKYRTAEAAKVQLAGDLREVRRTAGRLVAYIRWLGADPPDPSRRAQRDEDVRQLEAVVAGVRAYDPSSDQAGEDLRRLANRCRDLERLADNYFASVTNDLPWLKPRAAFELVFLPANKRGVLRGDLISPERPDDDPLTLASNLQLRERDGTVPANPYPLAGLIELVGGSAELAENLRRLGPLSNAEVRLQDVWESEEKRTLRESVGREAAQLLFEAVDGPAPSPAALTSPKDVWLAEMRMLALAPLKARVSDDWREDEFFQQVERRYREDWLSWQVDRFHRDNANLNKAYSETVQLVEAPLNRREPAPSPRFRLKNREIQVDYAGPRDVRLEFLESAGAGGGGARPILVLDWEKDPRLTFRAESAEQGAPRQLRVPLAFVRDRNAWEAKLTAEQAGGVAEDADAKVNAWVESDGRVDWLDLKVRLLKQKPPAAELAFDDPIESTGGVVELYPNQSSGLGIRIRKNVDEKLSASVELESDGESIAWPIELPEGRGIHKLPPPTGKQILTIKRSEMGLAGTLTVRLRSDGQDLGRAREIVVGVRQWDSTNTFRVDTPPLDDERRLVFANVRRTFPEPPPQPIPVWLWLEGTPEGEGDGKTIEGAVAEVQLTYPVPPDFTSTFTVNLDVSGVPRAFRYEGSFSATGRLVPKKQQGVRIASPRPGSVFEPASAPEVELQVDGVRTEEGRLDLYLGVGGPSTMRRVDPPLVGGRRVDLDVVVEPDSGSARIESKVADPVERPFQGAAGFGRKTIVAELRRNGQAIGTSGAVDVFLLPRRTDSLPRVEFEPVDPRRKAVVLGDSVRVVVSAPREDRNGAKLYEAIDHVEFRFNRTEKFDPNAGFEAIPDSGAAVVRLDESGTLQESFSTKILKEESGKWYLAARPVIVYESDRAAREQGKDPGPLAHGRDVFFEFEAVAPGVAATGPAAGKPGRIRGKVEYFGRPARGAKVEIEGGASVEAGIADGEFAFPASNPGKYTVKATYLFSGKEYTGSQTVEIVDGDPKPVTVQVK